MITFSLIAALLAATALAFVMPPLLRRRADVVDVRRDELNLAVLRDQRRELDADFAAGLIDKVAFEAARVDLERRVLEDVKAETVVAPKTAGRWTTAAVAIGVPAIAAGLYLYLGTPAGLDPAQVAPPQQDAAHSVTQEQIEGMVAALAEKLKNNPDNADGWHMLARSYNALGRFPEAAQAYARLVALVPANADILADYADTLAMAMNRSLQGEPEKVIERALTVDPRNIKALALSGSAAFERRDYAAAAERWERIMALVPPDSPVAKSTANSIAEARQLAGQPAAAATAQPAPQASPQLAPQQASAQQAPAAAGAKLEGTVDIDPALRAQVSPEDTVFIFARAAQGPRFPLAVLKKQVKDLPATFALDDSMGMMPNVKMSDFPQLVVGARVSKTGSATPSAGDPESTSETVAAGAKGVQVRIAARRQ